MKIAIIGHAADKFTPATRHEAQVLISALLLDARLLISGGCHLGGIDEWAETIARSMSIPRLIHRPALRRWAGGYRERNLRIARDCDALHVIVVARYPAEYRGMRFDRCYHCNTSDHVKSGACWTAKRAQELGRPVRWHIVNGS
jgi:hypothetical protein